MAQDNLAVAGQCFKTGSRTVALTATSAEIARAEVSCSPNKSSKLGCYYLASIRKKEW
jgi:hypothetical protein